MEFIKELFKSKRGRAVLNLGAYVIFFIVIAVFFQTGGSTPSTQPEENNVTKTPIQVFDEMTNYEYSYQRDSISINGKVYRDNMYFTLDGSEYYVNDKIYQIINSEKVEISDLDELYLINNHDISKYLNHSILVSKNENYEEKVIENKYHIDNESVNYDVENMYITLYERDNVIYKVSIELDNDNIEIEYKNVGKVSNFTIDYE